MSAQGKKLKPKDEYDAIQDILKRIDEIKEKLNSERTNTISE